MEQNNENSIADSFAPNSRRKIKLVKVLLFLVAVWPFFHFYLVRRFEINPWKLGAFGMYSAPDRRIQIDLHSIISGKKVRLNFRGNKEVSSEAVQFSNRRKELGLLALPDRLAELILKSHPEFDTLILDVYRTQLNKKTAYVEFRKYSYRYPNTSKYQQ